jgi:hypothetical protein
MTITTDHLGATPMDYALSLDSDIIRESVSGSSGSIGVGGAIIYVAKWLFPKGETELSADLPTALEQRLQTIANPRPNLINPIIPSGMVISTTRTMLAKLGDLPAPRIFPAEDDGLSLEWRGGRKFASVEIGSSGSICLHVLNLETGDDQDETVGDIESAIGRLRQWLK